MNTEIATAVETAAITTTVFIKAALSGQADIYNRPCWSSEIYRCENIAFKEGMPMPEFDKAVEDRIKEIWAGLAYLGLAKPFETQQ